MLMIAPGAVLELPYFSSSFLTLPVIAFELSLCVQGKFLMGHSFP